MKRSVMRSSRVRQLVWICAALVLSAAQARASAPAAEPLDYTRPGQLVLVSGGRLLNLRCIGEGATTVVLDAGGGRFSTAWRKVQGEIATFARVCSYDRAGYGFSSPNDRPSTAMNIVDDLHQALERAGIRPPLVLVGHSAGGLYATLYADLYRSDVAGLVLVDPAFASQNRDNVLAAWSGYPDILAEQRAKQIEGGKLMRNCADLARAGKLTANLGSCPCITTPKDQPELASYVADYCSGPKQYEGMLAEEAALTGVIGEPTSISNEQETSATRSFGAMPLTVLTSASGWSYTRSGDLNARLTMVWRAGHVGLAARSTKGKVVVVPNSGHTIQGDQPAAVIEAVREVVEDSIASRQGR